MVNPKSVIYLYILVFCSWRGWHWQSFWHPLCFTGLMIWFYCPCVQFADGCDSGANQQLQSDHQQQLNIYSPDTLSAAQPTVSKHWSQKHKIRTDRQQMMYSAVHLPAAEKITVSQFIVAKSFAYYILQDRMQNRSLRADRRSNVT